MKKAILALLGLATILRPAGVFGQDTKNDLKMEQKAADTDDEDAPQGAKAHAARKARNAGPPAPAFAIGIEAGLNLASMSIFRYSNNAILGGRAGLVGEIRLSNKVYVQPGLFYVLNGGSGKNSYLTSTSTESVYVNTIEVPFIILLKLGQRRQFLLGAGGYIGDNISGHGTSELRIGSGHDDALKPIDYGWKICIGHQSLSGFFFKAAFQKGLAFLNPGPYSNNITTMCLAIDFGFVFGEHPQRKPQRAGSDDDMEMKR